MVIQQRAEKAKPWLALADALRLLIVHAGGRADGLAAAQPPHARRRSYWWSWEGMQQAQAFGLLALLTRSLFWWRGHYSLRMPFWDELAGDLQFCSRRS